MEKLIKAFNQLNKEMFEKKYNIKISAFFSYGSCVYKNKTPTDIDLIIVADKQLPSVFFHIDEVEIQAKFYTEETFQDALDNADISILECIYLDHLKNNELIKVYSTKDFNDNIILDNKKILDNLRSATSKKSSNSYVKSKKKLIISNDFDLHSSMKSLWHSFRMVDFSIQIIKDMRIKNYESMNYMYDQIQKDYNDLDKYESPEVFWEFIHKKYKPLLNKLNSEFKALTPKNNHNVKDDETKGNLKTPF